MADYALLVGINQYRDHVLLENAVRDVSALEPLLRNDDDGQGRWEVDVLRGHPDVPRRVTERALVEAVDRIVASAAHDKGHVLFYFSGHGDRLGGARRLVLQGRESTDPDVFHDLMDLIRRIHRDNGIKSATVILDCCYAGGVGDEEPSPIGKDRALLTASRDVTPDGIGNHSPFADKVIRCLKGDSGDLAGEITVTDLFEYVSKRFPRGAQNRPQLKVNLVSEPVVLRRGPRMFDPRMLVRLFPEEGDSVVLTWDHEGPAYPLGSGSSGGCAEERCNGAGTPHHHGRPYEQHPDTRTNPLDGQDGTEKQREFDEIKKLYRFGLVDTWQNRTPYVVIQNNETVKLSPIGRWYREQCVNGWI